MKKILKKYCKSEQGWHRVLTYLGKTNKVFGVGIVSTLGLFVAWVLGHMFAATLFGMLLISCFVYVVSAIKEGVIGYTTCHGIKVIFEKGTYIPLQDMENYFDSILDKYCGTRFVRDADKHLCSLIIKVMDLSGRTIVSRSDKIIYVSGDFLLDSAFEYHCHMYIMKCIFPQSDRAFRIKLLRRYNII